VLLKGKRATSSRLYVKEGQNPGTRPEQFREPSWSYRKEGRGVLVVEFRTNNGKSPKEKLLKLQKLLKECLISDKSEHRKGGIIIKGSKKVNLGEKSRHLRRPRWYC
jgi:hypothetical protein